MRPAHDRRRSTLIYLVPAPRPQADRGDAPGDVPASPPLALAAAGLGLTLSWPMVFSTLACALMLRMLVAPVRAPQLRLVEVPPPAAPAAATPCAIRR